MKHTIAAAVLILASLLAQQSYAATPISVALTLPHDHVLPGIPFDLVVTYTNISRQAGYDRRSASHADRHVRDGETVVMHNPEGQDQWDIGSIHEPVRLAPGESAQHAASWERGSIRTGSVRLVLRTGTYAIALELRVVDQHTDLLGTVTTPAVVLYRVDPVGIDAGWKRMQDTSGGKWSDNSFKTTKPGYALAGEIIQLYPSSGYYPYVLALRAFGEVRDKKSHISALLEAAERFTDSPAYPYLLTAAASCARYVGIVAEREGKTADAEKYLTLAKTKYREALSTKGSAAIRASSRLSCSRWSR
jgi:hypothetical protein